MMRRLIIMFALAMPAILAFADGSLYPDSRPLEPWQSFDPADYGERWLTLDRNEDGRIDYAVMVDDLGRKLLEALDYNHDGSMDTFYIYENDLLRRQEMDTNGNQQIDVWVYIRRGVYIAMWERDNSHDGVIDERVVYGPQD